MQCAVEMLRSSIARTPNAPALPNIIPVALGLIIELTASAAAMKFGSRSQRD